MPLEIFEPSAYIEYSNMTLINSPHILPWQAPSMQLIWIIYSEWVSEWMNEWTREKINISSHDYVTINWDFICHITL